ncbi:MAG: cyclopropane-fatty-acyl-phospholipid synthase family protein [Caulobacterales bacterium]
MLLDGLLQRFVQRGSLTMIDAKGVTHKYVGQGGPEVTIRLKDEKLQQQLFFNPELHAGEAYMDGRLTVEQGTIRDFLVLFAQNSANLRGHPLQKALRTASKKVKKLKGFNSEKASRENVRHHYDLSNDFYRLWLDTDMQYSCAYFMSDTDTLEQAQINKLRHIAAKLDLKPGQRILDIGSGWGGMALYLASVADVEVLGVTLSTEQHALATQRAKERGLDDRVRFELLDYRNAQGPFDRIVSVGMFEHVGVQQFEAYFSKIRDLLTEDGVALVHSIGRKGGPGQTGKWVRRYIFPGGYSPALSETLASVERSGLWVTDIEILRLHYAKTLRIWDERFQANRAQIAEMMDERFCRMWEFYLIISELSFSHGKHMNFQIQLTKHPRATPLTRDYMVESERLLPD